MHEDAQDIALALDGDHLAFTRLYDRHAPVVLSVCRKRAPQDAADAAQEAFIRAFRKLHELDAPDKFRPWVFAIARLVCREQARSAARRNKHEEHAMHLTQQTAPPPPEPARLAERSDQLDQLSHAIDQLEDDERLVVHLHYLDKDPVRAAAQALGLSRSGYYKLLSRARTHLESLMRETRSA
jgi:RNA polymerase sigma factor (sigma-70 family)